jgi:NAD(P)-dependent dehydrogenase (short-subunit alcohol dehydrogenase family)
VASLTSFVGFSEVIAYGASKAAVAQLTRSLANDWARYQIRVNAIAPGVFPTDLNRSLLTGTPRGDWLLRHTPLERFGDPEEIAGAAVYLASPAASFTTGEVLVVDGGFLARGVGPSP